MICVAKIARCGSTYLMRSIAGLPQKGHAPPEGWEEYGMLPTHRPPEDTKGLEQCERAIFLYGDVAAAVISTQEHRHDPTHFSNCGVKYDPDVDLLGEDRLGYEAMFDAWTDPPLPTMVVRYECLGYPLVRSVLEDWVGRRIEWLSWRPRRTTPTEDQRSRVQGAYAGLVQKVERADGFFVAGVS